MSPNRPISYLLSKCFISCAFLKKRGESNSDSEASKRSRPVKQVLLQYKITNCLISQDICTLFGRYLYSNSVNSVEQLKCVSVTIHTSVRLGDSSRCQHLINFQCFEFLQSIFPIVTIIKVIFLLRFYFYFVKDHIEIH